MKKLIEIFKELKATPRGKAILFFGFYFFFFVILIIIFRVSERGDSYLSDSSINSDSKYGYSINKIINNNYSFTYDVVMDSTHYTYDGTRYKEKELFTFNNVTYFKNDKDYFEQQQNIWIKTEAPYKFKQFLNIMTIRDILNEAYFVSKTDYESGKQTYNFLISTNNLYKLTIGIDLDIADDTNEIIVSTDEDKNVDNIKFILNDYCKNTKECLNSLEINLDYDNFGEIEEISSPI